MSTSLTRAIIRHGLTLIAHSIEQGEFGLAHHLQHAGVTKHELFDLYVEHGIDPPWDLIDACQSRIETSRECVTDQQLTLDLDHAGPDPNVTHSRDETDDSSGPSPFHLAALASMLILPGSRTAGIEQALGVALPEPKLFYDPDNRIED